jgi:ADP-heptose:LPS heptosyltransferase
MENCDLVISCDTALAHLAGALGISNWLALKHVPEWRWFLGRSDTPWYANTRLFRQPAPGDWDSVFRAMEAELILLRG